MTFAAYPRPVGAAVFHGSLDPLSVQSALSEDQSQGHARKPHAERRAQPEHRTGEYVGAAVPLTLDVATDVQVLGCGGFKAVGRPPHPCHVANAGRQAKRARGSAP